MKNFLLGVQYFIIGFKMLTNKNIRSFVIIPLIINIALFSILTVFALSKFSDWIGQLIALLPSWLAFLQYFLWMLLSILFFSFIFLSFATLCNFIASPFNGVLAQKIQSMETGQSNLTPQAGDWKKEILATFVREFQKLFYHIPKLIFLLIFSLIPFLNLLSPFFWFSYNSWFSAVQYCDLPSENKSYAFPKTIQHMKQHKALVAGFGATVFVCSAIPFVNFFMIPAAVIGGTLLWERHIEPFHNKKLT